MYIIIFGFFIIKLQISVSEPQFPPHIDLLKVGETIFNNEKFNILKITTHRVTDHFKDFMLRTESSYHPAKRVFIDKNGFRHDWSGFGEKSKSLRKTDLKHVSGSFETASEDTPHSEIILTDGNDNIAATVEDTNISDTSVSSNENENNHQEIENNASDNNDTVLNLTEEDIEIPKSKETTTAINLFAAIQKKNSSAENIIHKRLRQGRKGANKNKTAPATKAAPAAKVAPAAKAAPAAKGAPVAKAAPAAAPPAAAPAAAAPANKKTDVKKSNVKAERTVAKTTFFCPYFGTITMSAFID